MHWSSSQTTWDRNIVKATNRERPSFDHRRGFLSRMYLSHGEGSVATLGEWYSVRHSGSQMRVGLLLPLVVLVVVLALTALSCTGNEPAPSPAHAVESATVPTPDISAAVEAGIAATKGVEESIEATVTARVEATRAAEPTPAPPHATPPAPGATPQPSPAPTATPPPTLTPRPTTYPTLPPDEEERLIRNLYDCIHTGSEIAEGFYKGFF